MNFTTSFSWIDKNLAILTEKYMYMYFFETSLLKNNGWLNAKYSIAKITSWLGRSYKTVRHEINRCPKGTYTAETAQKDASRKMARAQTFTLTKEAESYIIENLVEPEQ